MFRGGGQTVFFEDRVTAAGESKIIWIQPSVLSISGESDIVTAQGVPFSPGVVQDLASATISTTITGTLSIQKVGMKDMEMILNTQAASNSGIDLPTVFQDTITSNAITVTGLTANQKVIVNITTEGQQQYLTQVTDAPDAAGEYQVTADTITFNTGDFTDGTQVTGVYFTNVSTGNIIGGNSASTAYGNVSFFGKLLNTQYTNPVQLYVQQLSIDTSFDLGLIGSAGDDIEIPVTLTTPSGWNRPYAFIFPTS